MNAAIDLSTVSDGAPPTPPEIFRAARPSRELLGKLAADAEAARAAGNLDDAVILLGVAMALRLAGRDNK